MKGYKEVKNAKGRKLLYIAKITRNQRGCLKLLRKSEKIVFGVVKNQNMK